MKQSSQNEGNNNDQSGNQWQKTKKISREKSMKPKKSGSLGSQ